MSLHKFNSFQFLTFKNSRLPSPHIITHPLPPSHIINLYSHTFSTLSYSLKILILLSEFFFFNFLFCPLKIIILFTHIFFFITSILAAKPKRSTIFLSYNILHIYYNTIFYLSVFSVFNSIFQLITLELNQFRCETIVVMQSLISPFNITPSHPCLKFWFLAIIIFP